MDLFVIRHATAEPRATDLEDSARRLTPRGRRRFEKVVCGLERLDIEIDRLYHSPLVRAVETAELLEPVLRGERVALAALACPADAKLLERLDGDVAGVVGHQPWLGQLIALALFGRIDDGLRFELKKGGVAWLTGEPHPGEMTLRALLPPRATRRLGR